MPELPEVETMVRDLRDRVIGHTFTAVDAPFKGSIVWPTYAHFERRTVGQQVLGIQRRGKFAAMQLASLDLLIVHRGMSGSLLLREPTHPMERHVRILLTLDSGVELRFNDPRKFGKIYVMAASGKERPLPWAHMGPEPLDSAFSLPVFRSALAGRTAMIKPLLLGQRVVIGLGNIYVDEALHLARVHPERRADTLTTAELRRLHAAIKEVLGKAVGGRGTTFNSYMDLDGNPGEFGAQLRVFGRTGEACVGCGSTLVKFVVGGRGTHICPQCQRT